MSRAFRALALASLLVCSLPGCRPADSPAESPAVPEGPSPAADRLLEQAADPAERAELEAVRDEVDAEMRAKAEALDAEIERLEKENAELRER